jgi:hypothetical protein
MSSKSDREMLGETLQRVIRTETRLVTFGLKMGFDLKADEDIEVRTDDNVVTIKTLDIPYTSVIKACRRAGLHGTKVRVFFEDVLIAEMPV